MILLKCKLWVLVSVSLVVTKTLPLLALLVKMSLILMPSGKRFVGCDKRCLVNNGVTVEKGRRGRDPVSRRESDERLRSQAGSGVRDLGWGINDQGISLREGMMDALHCKS
jgi:hypothetical protein